MPDKTPKTQTPPRRALTLDVEKYQRMLDAPDVNLAQREEVIKALWSIIIAFSDLGYNLKPIENTCGKDAETRAEPRFEQDNLLYYSSDLPEQFAQSAAPHKGARHD